MHFNRTRLFGTIEDRSRKRDRKESKKKKKKKHSRSVISPNVVMRLPIQLCGAAGPGLPRRPWNLRTGPMMMKAGNQKRNGRRKRNAGVATRMGTKTSKKPRAAPNVPSIDRKVASSPVISLTSFKFLKKLDTRHMEFHLRFIFERTSPLLGCRFVPVPNKAAGVKFVWLSCFNSNLLISNYFQKCSNCVDF